MEKNKDVSADYLMFKRNNARNTAAVENNPCAKENAISMKCLDKNNYIKSMCEEEFENYKLCKKFWYYVASDRADKGLPIKMTPEEREQAKRDFAKEISEKAGLLEKRREEFMKANRARD